jgi:hypothetical protein
MSYANAMRGRFAFKRDRLPNPAGYHREQGLKLTGGTLFDSEAEL